MTNVIVSNNTVIRITVNSKLVNALFEKVALSVLRQQLVNLL